ncbi:hypothetical protein HRbin16_00121 [bacterium HR16]|nr:hypothetical protein HRbin16_00121 [bacterium HR16]
MPRFDATSRNDLIHYLRRLGFDGPFSGGKHQFMQRGGRTVRLPNPKVTSAQVCFLEY